ncbi:17-beta-hydroxysteroid dehydrogenase type 6-like [Mytilus californianus]|uniref:17-beta-hydroxysteroid dehydrogenase type 6-like n=1 Tax=Mytilus californianus TaxID=6549 RepID=UPI002247133A|nr:17-beta-hydroxysteroid dehydrogenase type 6-like [Mytilus californianus]XP_052082337.1 17-beta-hydroxysteroid dehydrogenase type 6-like [Mytilus californianus]XP_052082338.1 17-beta-hydroxysteroid dehydrogenase type 6-like [Mytilus californianus]
MMLLIVVSLFVAWLTYRWFRNTKSIDNFHNRYIFITGCDSGFGNMLAKRLDELGFNVFAGCLTQSGKEQLKRQTTDRVKVIPIDVSKTESIQKAFDTVKSLLPNDTGLWSIVNNAGIVGTIGPVQWLTREDYRSTFEINTLGIVETTRIFLPLVLKEKGRIVNITSMMGRIAAANSTYVVSKFAAEGYLDVLRRELYKRGVSVHILEPGFFRTSITDIETACKSVDGTFRKTSGEMQKYYGESYLNTIKDEIKDFLQRIVSPHTNLVVDAYVHALTSKYPKYRYIVGKDAKFTFRLLWNLPEWASDYILTRKVKIPQAEQDL